MPAKGKSKITKTQKAVVAAGRIAGKTLPQIAKDAGISPKTVGTVVTSPEVQGLLNRAYATNEPTISRVWGKLWESLERDFELPKFTERAEAREQAARMLQLGQPKLEAPAAGGAAFGGSIQLGEMLTHYRAALYAAPAPQEPGQ